MLSITKCRRLIPGKTLSNEELRQLRDDLYRIASVAVEMFLDGGGRGGGCSEDDSEGAGSRRSDETCVQNRGCGMCLGNGEGELH